ncbi:MAG: sugar ABC transporter permease [Peptoniphilaceae bacterium]|nr:sugar ABC transporter permease [Peptoniphilaceae bacterium]MDY6018188.1 sugar ABC transporter permease [Anaerococcus sp.]
MTELVSSKSKNLNKKKVQIFEKTNMKPIEFVIYIVLPLLPLIVFWFFPMIVSFLISFTDWDYISPNYNLVNFSNYSEILSSGEFLQALKNTVVFGFATVIPTLILGFIFALLLEGNIKFKSLFKSFLFSPWITPMVAMSIVWSWMFRPDIGLINKILSVFGAKGPAWLSDPTFAMLAVIIVTVWKNAGRAMIFYTDTMAKIPKELFEVGSLEGMTFFQKIKYIYLPQTRNTSFFLLIINLISSIQAYDQFSVLTGGGPSGTTRTLLYLFYQMAFEQFNMGKATAVSVIIVIITALLSIMMYLVRKRSEK